MVNPRWNLWSNASEFATGNLKPVAYQSPRYEQELCGGDVNSEEHCIAVRPALAAKPGFTTEDIVWAVGIWSVILTLSPVILFYMLMVA